MDVVFNINKLGLEGLGATLISLVRNCSDNSQLKLHFLCASLDLSDKFNIKSLLQKELFSGEINFIDFDPVKLFGNLKSLHGDYTNYGRLLIPGFIKNDSALYLDSDLIILIDILLLNNYDFRNEVIAATFGCKITYSLDHSFFEKRLNWNSEMEYFNSGVLLFNIKKWRETGMDDKWKKLANKYPDELTSHDQTLLNAICEGSFAHLDPAFNKLWEPGSHVPENINLAILHFSGSPKPWDLFGRFVHRGYSTWQTYNSVDWSRKYSKLSGLKLSRSWKIKKSIFRHLLREIKGLKATTN